MCKCDSLVRYRLESIAASRRMLRQWRWHLRQVVAHALRALPVSSARIMRVGCQSSPDNTASSGATIQGIGLDAFAGGSRSRGFPRPSLGAKSNARDRLRVERGEGSRPSGGRPFWRGTPYPSNMGPPSPPSARGLPPVAIDAISDADDAPRRLRLAEAMRQQNVLHNTWRNQWQLLYASRRWRSQAVARRLAAQLVLARAKIAHYHHQEGGRGGRRAARALLSWRTHVRYGQW